MEKEVKAAAVTGICVILAPIAGTVAKQVLDMEKGAKAAIVTGLCVILVALGGVVSTRRILRRRSPEPRAHASRGEAAPTYASLYHSRQELPDIKESVASARQEICLLAIHARRFIEDTSSVLRDKLPNGLSLRILEMSQTLPDGSANPYLAHYAELTQAPEVSDDVRGATKKKLHFLSELKQSLGTTVFERVRINVYDTFPTATYLIVDPKLESGFAFVTAMLPFLDMNTRPVLRLTKANGIAFERICSSFDMLWAKSRRLEMG